MRQCAHLAPSLTDSTDAVSCRDGDQSPSEGGSAHMLQFLQLVVCKYTCCFLLRNNSGRREGLGKGTHLPTSGKPDRACRRRGKELLNI